MGRPSSLHGPSEESLVSAQGRPPPGSDAERWRDAAERWQRRAPQRDQKKDALHAGNFVEADTPERLARWVERHEKWFDALTDAAPPTVPADAEVPARHVIDLDRPLTREDVSNELVERIVGRTRDLLSVEFFEMGLLAARCVGLVTTRGQANGTGFLVAPGMMLTNEHVLRTADMARDSDLELDFEDNRHGEAKRVEVFRLRPETFFLAHKALDFALVALDLQSQNGTQLDTFSVLPLIGEEGKVRIGEAVNVVQHPGGRVKQIAIRNNQLVDLPEGAGLDAYFHYEADTEKGSSGAPVFNDFWEVVALHHSGVPRTDAQGRLVDANGKVLGAADASKYEWVANEGVRVSRIVAAIRAADLPEHMRALRDRALETWSVRGQPATAVEAALSPVAGTSDEALDEAAPTAPASKAPAPGSSSPEVDRGVPRGQVHEAVVVSAQEPSVVELTVPLRLRLVVQVEPVADD